MTYLLRIFVCILIVFSSYTSAVVIHNDVNIDLSNDLLNPTTLPDISLGSFDINGHLTSDDRDFFTINLVDSQLESLQLTEWSSPLPFNWWITINGSTADYLNQSVIGENILEASLSPSLDTSASSYVIGIETGSLPIFYSFQITTSANAIPLPAGIYLFLSGLVGLGLIRGRNG